MHDRLASYLNFDRVDCSIKIVYSHLLFFMDSTGHTYAMSEGLFQNILINLELVMNFGMFGEIETAVD